MLGADDVGKSGPPIMDKSPESLDPSPLDPSPLAQSVGSLGAVFARLAEFVYAPAGVEDVFAELCRTAPMVLPGCDHASVMLRRDGRFSTVAASDEVAREIDRAELMLDDGPCVDAITEEAAQIDADLTDGSPWPQLATWVLTHTPVRGMLGYRLKVDETKVGALNIFSDTPGALTTAAADQAAVFAAFTAIAARAASHREGVETLRDGLRSNREIGKAVGLLMAFHKVSDDEAFAILRKTANDLNLKLADVAREILDYHRGAPGSVY